MEILVNNASGWLANTFVGAAKAAQESYTLSAAHELGRFGITANMVHPPITDTGWITSAIADTLTSAGPLHHIAQPKDVADVIIFLASQQARCITGQVITMS